MKTARQLEAELDELSRRFQSLMDNTVDGLIVIDEDGTIMEFNLAAECIFQYAADEVVGRNVSILMPAPYKSEHDGYISRYLATGHAKIIGIGREVSGQRKDGSVFPMELSVGEMPDGGTRNFVGTVRDITERRNIENRLLQASKMEAIGQLTGGIAHDFNNMLAILMMDLEMLADIAADDPESEELITEALDVTRTGAQLTQRLLAFARRQTLAPTRLNVNELVLSITGLLRRSLGEVIRIDTVGPQDLWPVMVDQGQLENALVNLAINARDAMPDGGRLAIRTENLTVDTEDLPDFDDLSAGDYVRLSFTDTGTGMTAEHAARAFEPFFTTKEGSRGTGLGLSMVYGFMKQSGGAATIYSAPGTGTTINLYFPRTAEDAPQAESRPGLQRTGLPTGSERILLVEDDARLRDRTADTLRKLGYTVSAAGDGNQALAKLAAETAPDLILTDVVMPGLDGPGLAHAVRERYPSAHILMMTGYAEASEAMQEAMTAGTLLLPKPFTRKQLADSVRQTLDG